MTYLYFISKDLKSYGKPKNGFPQRYNPMNIFQF